MVEALGDGIGKLLFGPEVIEVKFLVSARHAGGSLEWADAAAQGLVGFDIEEGARPDWTLMAPELFESLFELSRGCGMAQTA